MPDPQIPAGRKRRRGLSGTQFSWGQIVNYELNQDLRGDAWIEFCRQMLNDAIVKSARDARRQSLLSATPFLEEGIKGDPEAIRLRDFVAERLGLNGRRGRMSQSFEQAMQIFTRYEDNGYRYAEEIWKQEADGSISLDRWADRMPSAHYKWIRRGGRLVAVQQKDIQDDFGGGYYEGPTIPADKLVLFTREQEGDNYEGVGTLRACQFEYQLSQHALTMMGVALEKWAMSTPKVSYNRTEIFNDLKGSGSELGVDDVLDDIETSMRAYMAQEEAVIMQPMGVEIDTFGDGQLNLGGFESIERIITMRIQYAYLVQFLSLGQGATGARSVGETQTQFLYDGAQNSLDYIGDVISGPSRPGAGTIGRLVEYNFGPVDEALLPRLRFKGLKTTPLQQALGELAALKQNNLITDDNDFEEALRHSVGGPPMSDDARKVRAARHKAIITDDPLSDEGPTTDPR